MHTGELIALLEKLRLPEGEYVVFGGACLTIRNLRKLNDLDLFITKSLYKKLLNKGWQKTATGKRKPYLITKIDGFDIQAFSTWEGRGWQPKINSYISYPEIVEGIPFMPLKDLYEWKAATRRAKDLKDLELIDSFLNRKI